MQLSDTSNQSIAQALKARWEFLCSVDRGFQDSSFSSWEGNSIHSPQLFRYSTLRFIRLGIDDGSDMILVSYKSRTRGSHMYSKNDSGIFVKLGFFWSSNVEILLHAGLLGRLHNIWPINDTLRFFKKKKKTSFARLPILSLTVVLLSLHHHLPKILNPSLLLGM